GESDGPFPSETSVYEDAEAALGALVHEWRVKPENVYVYGHSLGAAVAIDLASKHPELGGLIVESAFTSIYDMARLDSKYDLFPVGLLLNQRFESLKKVSRLHVPVLYIHGTADRVIPYSMGVALYQHSGGRKRFVAVAGGGHDDNAAVAPVEVASALRELIR
ncbi:MAG: alpha/beta hydrolase, partial [Betaproteobacteria bacterium]|nr:alpha/beta hydrolase [Betaproteobacteria bacterium]